MPFRSRARVKGSVVLMRANIYNLFIHNYIRSLVNSILRSMLMVWAMTEPASYCLCV